MSSRSSKPLIIGEMPGPGRIHRDDRDLGPIAGSTGRKLAKLLGVSLEEYARRWDRVNVFLERREWNQMLAGIQAHGLYGAESGFVDRPLVVLLGRKVHQTFGFTNHPIFCMIPRPSGKMKWLLLPHPSGVCRWWNDPTNVDAAQRLLRAAYDFTQEKRHAASNHS